MGNLGKTVNKVLDLGTEIAADGFYIDKRVLDNIVEQSGRNADLIEPHLGKDVGDLKRMNKVRLTRGPRLAAMMKRRKKVCTANKVYIRVRPVGLDLFYDIFDTNHPELFYI